MVDVSDGALPELRRRDAVVLYRLPGPAGHSVGGGDRPPVAAAAVEALQTASQELVDTAREMFDVAYAGLHIVTPTARTALARTDHAVSAVTVRPDSLSATVMQLAGDVDVVEMRDVSQDVALAGNPFVDGRQGAVRFYAATTLIGREGVALGALCVSSGRPRGLTRLERAELRHLGYAAVHLLDRYRRAAERGL